MDNCRKIIKDELNILLKRNSSILNGRYHYYQGFHDLALYIMLLFFNNNDISTLILQRLSEFFLRDFLGEHNEHEKPDYCMINEILSSTIYLTDPETIKALRSKVDNTEPYYALSWVLSWFTHNLTNISKIYRILDFLICSHPFTIFHVASQVFIKNNFR